jgi:hypothetical protein
MKTKMASLRTVMLDAGQRSLAAIAIQHELERQNGAGLRRAARIRRTVHRELGAAALAYVIAIHRYRNAIVRHLVL